MVRILAVCTGNTCRSPMLTAALQMMCKRDGIESVVVEGAGVGHSAGSDLPAAEHAQTCFPGLLEGHRSTHISQRTLKDYDLILCLTEGHRIGVLEEMQKQNGVVSDGDNCKIRVFPGGLPDPVGGPLTEYEDCADHCRRWASELAHQLAETGS